MVHRTRPDRLVPMYRRTMSRTNTNRTCIGYHQLQMVTLSEIRRRVLPDHKSLVLEQAPVRAQYLELLSYSQRFYKEARERFKEKD